MRLEGKAAVQHVQRKLAAAGLYDGPIDGIYGGGTDGGLDKALAAYAVSMNTAQAGTVGLTQDRPLAWGAKVSGEFRARVWWIANQLGLPADDLMACMAWESGRTFSPSVRNMAGSGATGLIQFMPTTAKGLGTTTDALAAMTAEDQLNYVYKYFLPYKGRLKNLGDIYMAILWPAGVGKADSYVLWDKGQRPTTYRQNAGLDVNKNGQITRGEALAKVSGLLAEGRKPGNLYPGKA